MRTIGVVTMSRSDYGIYLPVLREIQRAPDLRLYLIVSGMHLSPEFGMTIREIERDGFEIDERIEMLMSSDTPEGIAKSMGLGVLGFAQAYSRFRPDILVVLGDRFEMHAAALAALPFKIPVAHILGGEITEGAIDDALRHSMTKLSHLHLVSTEEYARRVRQLGEDPWRITVCGAPSLDNLHSIKLIEAKEIESRYGIRLQPPPLLVTFHPVTLEYEQTEWQVGEVLAALDTMGMPVVFTRPNADTNGRIIAHMMETFAQAHSSAWMVGDLGIQAYFSLMSLAAAMVGNSSSGIVEAPSFKLPVVNVGDRQRGRIRAENVIDVECSRDAILAGLRKALSPELRASLETLTNPYGDGHAAECIVQRLRQVELGKDLLMKRFYDARQPTTAD